VLEDKQQCVMQGEDAFQNIELNMWKVDFDIMPISKDFINLEHKIQTVQ
jgi:hypothetical protein